MLAVVTGMIATFPVGGVAWDYGQYALALERMGWDVVYLEDSGWYSYDPDARDYGEKADYGARFLGETLAAWAPSMRWHVRAMDGTTYGLPADELHALVAEADVFLNVSNGCVLRDEYLPSKRKVLVDTDPGWNHFVKFPRHDAFRRHDHFFTYAERIGSADCPLPDFGLEWHPTRPPAVLDLWAPRPPAERWTTVLTWDNYRRPIEHDGVEYGSKEPEFARIRDLPSQTGATLEIAAGGVDPPRDDWTARGWSVIDSHRVSTTVDEYAEYVCGSRGELSVAKNVYVATRSGWFSCRSVCYLAAGRPAVLQDTGFSERVPCGEGLLAFAGAESAAAALAEVEADYDAHAAAARAVAEEHFASDRVLGDMLERIGV